MLVGEVDGEIVGRITVTTTARDADISGFVVTELSRRQGIGTTMIEAAEAEASPPRLHAVAAHRGEARIPRALALYAGRGYERVGEGRSAGLRSPDGVVIHEPEPVWRDGQTGRVRGSSSSKPGAQRVAVGLAGRQRGQARRRRRPAPGS